MFHHFYLYPLSPHPRGSKVMGTYGLKYRGLNRKYIVWLILKLLLAVVTGITVGWGESDEMGWWRKEQSWTEWTLKIGGVSRPNPLFHCNRSKCLKWCGNLFWSSAFTNLTIVYSQPGKSPGCGHLEKWNTRVELHCFRQHVVVLKVNNTKECFTFNQGDNKTAFANLYEYKLNPHCSHNLVFLVSHDSLVWYPRWWCSGARSGS